MAFVRKINVNYVSRDSGLKFNLPALYTDQGIVLSHLRYLAWFNAKSESWRERSILSLRLLIQYIDAVPSLSFTSATELLKSFTERLVTGTIDYETYNDPLQLFWKPRNIRDANGILFHITHYTDFLALQEGHEASLINPFRKATSYEARLNWCAYYHRQQNVFLSHLSNYKNAKLQLQKIRVIGRFPENKIQHETISRFPESKIQSLLEIGFERDGIIDYKSQAITMLLNYGGLRKSEIFHIYTSDITLHPIRNDEALVRVYHPQIGLSPDNHYKTRAEYLKATTDYQPRNQYRISERLYAGWKNPLLTSRDAYYEVIFSPPEKARDFLNVWARYLKFQRIEPPATNAHPFAFTNSHGAPETLKNFQRLHKAAVEKIGMESRKELGTTEHGHRHAYGYRSRSYGLDQIEIQKAMHHKSPNSCLVYINPTSEDVRKKLRETEC